MRIDKAFMENADLHLFFDERIQTFMIKKHITDKILKNTAVIPDIDNIMEILDHVRTRWNTNLTDLSNDNSSILAVILSVIYNGVLPEKTPANIDTISCIASYGRVIDADEYKSNTYVSEFEENEHGRYSFMRRPLKAWYPYFYDFPITMRDRVGLAIPQLYMLTGQCSVPHMERNGRIIDTLTPAKMQKLKTFIDGAAGDVTILGCGTGYLPYMLLFNEEVSSITVVDGSSSCLELFYENVVSKADIIGRLKLVHCDPMRYLHITDDLGQLFVDISADMYNIDRYLELVRLRNRLKDNSITIYPENGILQAVADEFCTALLSELRKMKLGPETGHMHEGTNDTRLKAFTQDITKDLVISDPTELKYLVSESGIREMISCYAESKRLQ